MYHALRATATGWVRVATGDSGEWPARPTRRHVETHEEVR